MLSIDEVIEKHKKLKINAERTNYKLGAFYSAEENEQIAEWLEELKDYRDKNKMVVRIDVENMDSIKDKIEELSKYAENQYNKAIDYSEDKLLYQIGDLGIRDIIQETAKQLKAGGENDNLRR